jgi:predicted nucleic acid-binding protein
LSEKDRRLFQSLLARITVIDVCTGDVHLKERVQAFRAEKKLKLPDAVIAASAAIHECILVTADKQLLKIPGLDVQGYQAV